MTTPRLRRARLCLLAGLCLATLEVVAAPGFGFMLKGTNFAAFGEHDLSLFLNTTETTAGSQPDGVEVRFAGPHSGASGRMSVTRSFEQDGHPCREIGGETTLKGNTEPFRLSYCQDKTGRWRLASSSSP